MKKSFWKTVSFVFYSILFICALILYFAHLRSEKANREVAQASIQAIDRMLGEFGYAEGHKDVLRRIKDQATKNITHARAQPLELVSAILKDKHTDPVEFSQLKAIADFLENNPDPTEADSQKLLQTNLGTLEHYDEERLQKQRNYGTLKDPSQFKIQTISTHLGDDGVKTITALMDLKADPRYSSDHDKQTQAFLDRDAPIRLNGSPGIVYYYFKGENIPDISGAKTNKELLQLLNEKEARYFAGFTGR